MTSLTRGELPLPPFYDRENVRSWAFAPDQSALLSRAQAWRSEHAVPPAGSDRARVRLLLIDLQKDYFPEGKFPLWNTEATLSNILDVTRKAKVRGDLVIHVQHIAFA